MPRTPKEMVSDHVLANASEYGEFAERLGRSAPYDALLGDRDPPLDYRSHSGN